MTRKAAYYDLFEKQQALNNHSVPAESKEEVKRSVVEDPWVQNSMERLLRTLESNEFFKNYDIQEQSTRLLKHFQAKKKLSGVSQEVANVVELDERKFSFHDEKLLDQPLLEQSNNK